MKTKDVELDKLATRFYTEYAVSVLEDRAIPDYRDGMNPVNRRILWSSYQLGVRNTSKPVKAARIVGDCFAAGTLVSTPNGVTAIENLEIGDTVLTPIGERKVTACIANPKAKMYGVQLANGKFAIVTAGQLFKVKRGLNFVWVKTVDLRENDEVVCELP